MIRFCLVAVLSAASAFAETPADYRSVAPATLQGSDALHRLTLPFEAYRDARRDLADIRVFNARGEAVPIAFAGEPESAREAPAAVSLALFPVSAAPATRGTGNIDVTVRSNGTLVSVQSHGGARARPPQKPVAWVIDASQLKQPIRNVVVDWEVGPGTEVARVTVEASDDLKSWRGVTSRAAVMRLEHAGQTLAQRNVDLGALRAKYLRVTGEPREFALRSVAAEFEPVVKPAPRLTRLVTASPGAKPGEYVFDLGARLPVEAVRVVLAEPNSIAPVTIATRDGDSGEWRRVASATFYRLVRDAVELQSPPMEIGRRPARHWSIQLDARSPGLGGSAPSLEVQWRPAQVVFVARGEAPFSLAFGNPDARRGALAVNELIPGYEPRAEMKLAEARLGEVRSVARSGDWLRGLTGDTSPRKLMLWAILLLGVAALGWMAWQLQRQMKERKPPGEGAGGG